MSSQLPKRPKGPPAGRALKAVGTVYRRPSPAIRPTPPVRLATKNKADSLWYALCLPQLHTDNGEGSRTGKERLQQLATTLSQLSSSVSIQPPDSLVFEVRSSLHYFGGIENIRSRLQQLLAPMLTAWGLDSGFEQAASPTPAASLLLARSGCNLLIYRKDNLRSALASLPLDALAPHYADAKARNNTRQLRNSGLLVMRDVWRLPRRDLARRFGPDFLRQLDICLGNVAMPVNAYQDAPFFSTQMDFDYAVENSGFVLHASDELLGRLCLYLRQRELAAAHLQLHLRHESREDSVIELELRQASRSLSHLSLLLETRIQALTLQAPITGLQLQVQRFDPFSSQHATLSSMETGAEQASQEAIIPLLEQLQARLGNDAVRSIHTHPEHGPELAGSDKTFVGTTASAHLNEGAGHHHCAAPVAARPCWLLAQAEVLLSQDRDRLQLLSGPERIETRWWAPHDIQRDYYVARNRQGMRLWIYHQRNGGRDWYLHGVFD